MIQRTPSHHWFMLWPNARQAITQIIQWWSRFLMRPCGTRAHFLSLAPRKLRLCSANHRAGYLSNLACDWLSIVWAYSEQETENRPRSPCVFKTKISEFWKEMYFNEWWLIELFIINIKWFRLWFGARSTPRHHPDSGVYTKFSGRLSEESFPWLIQKFPWLLIFKTGQPSCQFNLSEGQNRLDLTSGRPLV